MLFILIVFFCAFGTAAGSYRNIVGFHLGPGGTQNGVADYLQRLDSQKIPFSIKNVDGIAFLDTAAQLRNASGVDHDIIWRSTNTDVPDYTQDPQSAAQSHWQKVKSNMPTQLPALKEHIAIEVINEPDQTKCAWLANFSLAISKLAVAEGYRIYNFGWSTGTPFVGASNPNCWNQTETKAFLQYAATQGGKVGVALHEYSNSMNITNEWPWLLGRNHFLFDTLTSMGINLMDIPVSITEWGWTACHTKLPPSDGISDIDTVMRGMGQYSYTKFPNIRSAMMWYLGPWSCPVSSDADQLVEPVTNYTISTFEK
eukprot:m.46856 g.46856  ORF g.46856 m.46856 type:complete len:313 (+) comp10419_c0_seq1:74-1012(+)